MDAIFSLKSNIGSPIYINGHEIKNWTYRDINGIATIEYGTYKIAIAKAVNHSVASKSNKLVKLIKKDNELLATAIGGIKNKSYFDKKLIAGYIPSMYYGHNRLYRTINGTHTHYICSTDIKMSGPNIISKVYTIKELGSMEEICPWMMIYNNDGDQKNLVMLMNVINSTSKDPFRPFVARYGTYTIIICLMPALFEFKYIAIEI